MPSSKLLKERIESIQDTMKITNAMYLISSSKLRKARKNYQNVSPYFNRMRDTISRVVPHLPEEPVHPFFHERNTANPVSYTHLDRLRRSVQACSGLPCHFSAAAPLSGP